MQQPDSSAGFSFGSSLPRTRESSFVSRRISLDTRLRGYDVNPGSPFLLQINLARIFKEDAE